MFIFNCVHCTVDLFEHKYYAIKKKKNLFIKKIISNYIFRFQLFSNIQHNVC